MDIRAIARQIQSHGDGNDKILAHINAKEAALLSRLSGGSVNAKTGLPQFGFFDSLGGVLGPVAGFLGSKGGGSPGSSAASQTQTIAQPYLDESQKLLKQYDTGQLNAADQANLKAGTDAAKAQERQYYAGAGLGDSSAQAQAEGQIGINEAQVHQNLLNSYLTHATNLFGTAYGPLATAINYNFNQGTQNQSAISGLIGNIFGAGGGGQSPFGELLSSIGGMFGGGGSSIVSGGSITDLGGGGSVSPLFTSGDMSI